LFCNIISIHKLFSNTSSFFATVFCLLASAFLSLQPLLPLNILGEENRKHVDFIPNSEDVLMGVEEVRGGRAFCSLERKKLSP